MGKCDPCQTNPVAIGRTARGRGGRRIEAARNLTASMATFGFDGLSHPRDIRHGSHSDTRSLSAEREFMRCKNSRDASQKEATELAQRAVELSREIVNFGQAAAPNLSA